MKTTIIYGFAIFAMFFGSGNLVFPLEIGVVSAGSWPVAALGLMCTGVILPVMGLFVIKRFDGCYESFFGQLGRVARVALPLIMLSLLGPFGVVPRCITVAYGGVHPVFPSVSLSLFSALFCLLTLMLSVNESRLVQVLGKWLTPLLLAFLAVLIFAGIQSMPNMAPVLNWSESFETGFIRGYQTMDLIAAFFFSSFIFMRLKAQFNTDDVFKHAIGPSILGGFLLFIVYIAYVFLGAGFGEPGNSANILPTISAKLLGAEGQSVIAMLMLLSCLTTAVALTNLFARYISKLLGQSFIPVLLASLAITYAISLYDFTAIAGMLGPVLEVLYPGLIFLTATSLITKEYFLIKRVGFTLMTLAAIMMKF